MAALLSPGPDLLVLDSAQELIGPDALGRGAERGRLAVALHRVRTKRRLVLSLAGHTCRHTGAALTPGETLSACSLSPTFFALTDAARPG